MKTVAISGRTGQGVETAGEFLAILLAQHGIRYRTWRDFSTVIRGGLTAYELSILEGNDPESVPVRTQGVELAVVWDDAGADAYRPRLRSPEKLYGSRNVRGLDSAHSEDCPRMGFNLWALGILAGALGISLDAVLTLVRARFGDQVNGDWVARGHARGVAEDLAVPPTSQKLVRLSANQALCLGALAGGVRFYCGYPITPASEILEIMADSLPILGGMACQVEDEIAAIHMAIGASYAGARTFVATSGPGLSLMTEGIGYAATIEVPLVVVDNQRGGPSTGMPTKTEQADVHHALYAGHGEFPRIVLAPSSSLDAIQVMQEALNLADRYQCVVMLLLDLDMAMNHQTYPWEAVKSLLETPTIDRGPTILSGAVADYRRYNSAQGVVSLRTVPGVLGGAYVASGDEHDDRGWMEPDFRRVRPMVHARRLHKVDKIDYARSSTQIGQAEAPTLLVGTGSMTELIIQTVRCNPSRYQGLILRQILPLPDLSLNTSHVQHVIVAEYNATGQLLEWIRPAIPNVTWSHVRRFDGEIFTFEEFFEAVAAAETFPKEDRALWTRTTFQ